MATMKQCCKNCVFAKWERNMRGNLMRKVAGNCMFVVKLPVLPESVNIQERRSAIWPDDGEDCLTYENTAVKVSSERCDDE